MATFTLVHGAWDGGWAWRAVARELQVAGHEVFTPTLTGSGERVHLASPAVDLSTHIVDIVNVLRHERLAHVILVGYSYSGMVITGVAEQVPEQLSQLIYLDAFVPQDGQSLADLVDPEVNAELEQVAQTVMKPITERIAARIRTEGWPYYELPFDHFPLCQRCAQSDSLRHLSAPAGRTLSLFYPIQSHQ